MVPFLLALHYITKDKKKGADINIQVNSGMPSLLSSTQCKLKALIDIWLLNFSLALLK